MAVMRYFPFRGSENKYIKKYKKIIIFFPLPGIKDFFQFLFLMYLEQKLEIRCVGEIFFMKQKQICQEIRKIT